MKLKKENIQFLLDKSNDWMAELLKDFKLNKNLNNKKIGV